MKVPTESQVAPGRCPISAWRETGDQPTQPQRGLAASGAQPDARHLLDFESPSGLLSAQVAPKSPGHWVANRSQVVRAQRHWCIAVPYPRASRLEFLLPAESPGHFMQALPGERSNACPGSPGRRRAVQVRAPWPSRCASRAYSRRERTSTLAIQRRWLPILSYSALLLARVRAISRSFSIVLPFAPDTSTRRHLCRYRNGIPGKRLAE